MNITEDVIRYHYAITRLELMGCWYLANVLRKRIINDRK